MTSNELRIGNLISFDNEIISVLPNTIVAIYSLRESKLKSSALPIRITIYWLKKFGFNGKINHISKCGNFYLGYDAEYGRHDMSIWYQKGSFCFSHTNTFTVIKYVHQLQNLYFLLTGKELQINLK
jgi:hypothetical protein